MLADIFHCSSCSESYDLELHTPKILISCSHCLCLRCLKNIFINHSPQERQCPSCDLSFLPAINTPEAFPTDPTLFYLLQGRPKTNIENDTEPDYSPQKDEHEESFQHNVRKKKKIEQEMDDELEEDLQEEIISQFMGMRKILSPSQNIETPVELEVLPDTDSQEKTTLESITPEKSSVSMIKEEYSDAHQNEHPLAKIANRLKGIFAETQEALNRLPKVSGSQTNEVLTQQIPQENTILSSASPENEKEQIVEINKEEALKETGSGDRMEEEIDQEEEEKVQNKDQETENQVMEIEAAESQLKLDFFDKDISGDNFCSQSLWNRINRERISHLEVNFSSSSLPDQLFIEFVDTFLTKIENLKTLSIDLTHTKISNESIKVLSQRYLKNYKLKNFVLNCSETSIGYEGLRHLDDGLNCLAETLEDIELLFDSTCIQGEKFLDALPLMNQLKALKLSFEDSQISSGIASSVVLCLQPLLKNLESLELNFNGTGIDDRGLENLSNNIIFHLEKLRYFKFCLGETFVSDDLLLDFFQSLGPLAPNLVTFELDLHSTRLTNETFKCFCEEALSKMLNLENLKLDLSGTKITNVCLKNLLLPANKLKSLALNLSGNEIHDSGLQTFKENNNWKNIKSIDFQIGQTDVTDEALQGFLNTVEKGCDTKGPLSLTKGPFEFSSDQGITPKNDIKEGETPKHKKVYANLKKELLLHYGHKQDPSRLSAIEAYKLIKKLGPEVYENILIKILTKLFRISKVEAREIGEWKEIIQTMISSRVERTSHISIKNFEEKENQSSTQRKQKKRRIERKEDHAHKEKKQGHSSTNRKPNHSSDNNYPSESFSRSDPQPSELVLSFRWMKKYGQEINFREKVVEILKSIEARPASVFNKKLLDYIRQLSKTYRTWQIPPKLKDMTCFLNWWYRFMKGDQEITDLWKNRRSVDNI